MTRISAKLDPALREPCSRYDRFRVIVIAAHGGCTEAIQRAGGQILSRVPMLGAYNVSISAASLGVLAHSGAVAMIEPDRPIALGDAQPNGLMGVNIAHQSGYTGAGVGIAIADTGIYPHKDFGSRILRFYDLVGGIRNPYDDNGHGTFCAGVAAGDGAASGGLWAGVATGAGIVSIKCMDAMGGGTTSDLLRAMQFALDHKRMYNIRVFSLSLGAQRGDSVMGRAMVAGVEMLWRNGIFMTVAAGNDGPSPSSINAPGNAQGALTVGAADTTREPYSVARFSSRGPADGHVKPDILAPGVNLRACATDPSYIGTGSHEKHGYTIMSGTSMAAPVAAGCAALLFEKKPELTPEEAKARIMETARALSISPNDAGAGLIDMAAALGLRDASAARRTA